MSEVYDVKRAIPNKLLNENGTITDLMGQSVLIGTTTWNSKRSLPNKFLNPDGTYSTLQEIIGGATGGDLFIIVQELPQVGIANKIYLVPKQNGGFYEYAYNANQWNIIGDVDIDLSNYSTTQEVQDAIALALQTAETYTDNKIKNFVPLQSFPEEFNTNGTTIQFFNSIKAYNPAVGSYFLGLVRLSDMPEGLIQAEVQVSVYPNKVLYATMRSADLAPYMWEANSFDYVEWKEPGADTLASAKEYTDSQIKDVLSDSF